MAHPGGRPAIYDNVEDLETAIAAYFARCDERQRPYTMGELALAIGFGSRQSLLDYEEKDKFSCTIKLAREKVRADNEARLLSGSNAAGCIFWLKNNGERWKDKTETEVSGEMSVTTITRRIIDGT